MSNATRARKTKCVDHSKDRVTSSVKTVPSTREELEAIYPLRPIKTEREYDRARALAAQLVVLTDPTPLQEEWYDQITDYMEAYEDVHYPM
ncbi:MAG: hypothetical protein GHCLOJNM_00196 [bacterium]|nr:hypothetical protein [bacterium]